LKISCFIEVHLLKVDEVLFPLGVVLGEALVQFLDGEFGHQIHGSVASLESRVVGMGMGKTQDSMAERK
jgi:hypothetical protein